MRQRNTSLVAGLVGPALFGFQSLSVAAGPTRELFITTRPIDGGTSAIAVVQGSSIKRSWATVHGNELALAVRSTVRTLGLHSQPLPGDFGAEYSIAGGVTGIDYAMPVTWGSGVQFLDGASDGVFNYAFDFGSNTAYRFDSGWANPVALFKLRDSIGRLGIAYDPSNNSLWLSGFGNSMIENRAMDGALLDSFQVAHALNNGLALNPDDGTLWLLSVDHPGMIEQFARTGSFRRSAIGRQTYTALQSQRLLGAEFAMAALRWKLDGNGDWTAGQNWDGPVPNGAGSIANLTSAITAPRTITLNAARSVGRLNVDNVNSYTISGSGSLTLASSDGLSQINVGSGAHVIALPVALANDTRVMTIGAASSLDATAGVSGGASVTLTKSGPGTLRAGNLRVGAVNTVGGALQILPQLQPNTSAGASFVRSLTIAAGAGVDLTNNALVIDYTGATPIAALRSQLADARLITSASGSLGYGEASTLGLSDFAGQPVDTSSLLIKFTYPGDANLDGQVDITDLSALATSWQTGGVWTGGDFDYSGFVDISDLALLASNWQAGVSAPGLGLEQAMSGVGFGGIAVPEPGAVFGVFGLVGLVCQRRRR